MKPRVALIALLTAAAAACGGSGTYTPAPASPIPPYPDALARRAPGAAEAPARSAFAQLADRVIDAWIEGDPALGRSLGLHAYDGRVADYSAAAIAARVAQIEALAAELAQVDRARLSADEALDLAILQKHAELFLFRMRDLAIAQRSPQFYDELFSVNAYLDRDYAPLAERAAKLVAHEKAALAEVPHITRNLKSPLAKPMVEVAIKIYKGYGEYLRGDVVKQLAGVGDAAFQADFQKTNAALAAAADGIVAHLKDVELKKADGSHVLGAARYQKLLRAQEGLELPLAAFKAMGEENLAANKKAYEALAKSVKTSRPTKEALLDEATRLMDASRRFVVDKKLVTIPSDDQAQLKETPPFMRWNAAFLNDAGPFEEKATTGFYYITRPDPSWPKKEQDEYVMPLGILLATTVHEVYPGHFLQGQWAKKAPTRAQKVFGSYSFIEGWAHYAEQMMVDEGFGAGDPQNKLGMLSDALLRNCRFVVSLGVHTEGMSLAAAEKRFVQDCKQDKATAREQANRAAFDPGYFAYTLGKIQILALREEAKKRLGERFSLQRFHDALLAHGAPPVPLVRARVLAELGAEAKE